jgi:hypothetical protein
MSEDEQKNREIVTRIMSRTGAQSIDGLAGKVYVRTTTLNPWGTVFRKGVPAMLKAFEMREFRGKRRRCVVATYRDGAEYFLPCESIFKAFQFIDDEAEEMTITWIPKAKLEKGF